MRPVDEAVEKLRRGPAISECMLWNDPSLNVSLPAGEMEILCKALKAHGRVTTLSLSGNTITETSAVVLAKYISVCKTIKVLDLSFCGLKASSLIKIARSICGNVNLEGVLLNASYNDMSPEGAVELSRALTSAHSSGLKHLVLRFNPLLEKGVSSLLLNCHSLESLDCSYAGVKSPVAQLITSLSSSSIKTVRLCGMELKGNEMQMLLSSVPLGCTLLLDEDSPKECHSPQCLSPVSASSPVMNRDVEELMWKEELAILRGAMNKDRSPPKTVRTTPPKPPQPVYTEMHRSPPRSVYVESRKSPPKPATSDASHRSPPLRSNATISPTSSSPPPLASSPYYERSMSSERSVSRQESLDRVSVSRTEVTRSETASTRVHTRSPPVQQDDGTVKSLSLALNVLHDNYNTVSKERNSLKMELEAEVAMRKELEKQVSQLRYELRLRDSPKKEARGTPRETREERAPRKPGRSVSPKVRSNSASRRPLGDVAGNTFREEKSKRTSPARAPTARVLKSASGLKAKPCGAGKSPPRGNALTRTLTNRSRRTSTSTTGKF